MKAWFKRLGRQALGLIPTKLPTGMTEFESWAEDFINTYTLPTSDVDSVKFTLASIIMHLGPQVAYKPKFYFFLTLKAGAAKQVAGAVFYQIKEAQKAKEEAARKAAADESAKQNEQTA